MTDSVTAVGRLRGNNACVGTLTPHRPTCGHPLVLLMFIQRLLQASLVQHGCDCYRPVTRLPYLVRQPQLLQVAQPLELRRVYECHASPVQLKVPCTTSSTQTSDDGICHLLQLYDAVVLHNCCLHGLPTVHTVVEDFLPPVSTILVSVVLGHAIDRQLIILHEAILLLHAASTARS